MRGGLHELLMLELAAQIDGGRHRIGKLAHACHAPIEARTRTAIGVNPTHRDKLVVFTEVGIGGIIVNLGRLIARTSVESTPHAEKAPGNLERAFAVAHHVAVGAGTHKQLQRREQSGFARTRLACENGDAHAKAQATPRG